MSLSQFDGKTGENRDLIGDKITFSVRELLSRKTEIEDMVISIPLAEAEPEPETLKVHLSGGSPAHQVSKTEGDPRPRTLVRKPGEPDGRFLVEGIEITGMGYIEGMLHIQTAVENSLENDNHGVLFLVDGEGNRRECDYTNSFWGTEEETRTTKYQDCIFDIAPEEAEKFTLHGYFVTSGFHMEGNWSVTFALEPQPES